jgi:hypothetical protein
MGCKHLAETTDKDNEVAKEVRPEQKRMFREIRRKEQPPQVGNCSKATCREDRKLSSTVLSHHVSLI